MGGHLGSAALLVGHGLNTGAAAISRGESVSIEDTAFAGNKYLPDSIAEDVTPIETSGANTQVLGVATGDIAVGAMGEFVIVGPVTCLAGAAIAAGNAIDVLAANGKFDDSGGAAAQANVGIAYEAASGDGVLFRAFVNFLAYGGNFNAP